MDTKQTWEGNNSGENNEPQNQEDRLLAEYGSYLEDADLSEAQKKEMLLTLWRIMTAFVELGFSVKAGDNFSPDTEIGMDDVLKYLDITDTAHETVAPKFNNKNKKECDT